MTITIGTYLSAFWRNKYDFISSVRLLFHSSLYFSFVQFFSAFAPSPFQVEWKKSSIYYFYFQRVREKLIFNLSYTCSRFSRFCCFASHFLLLFSCSASSFHTQNLWGLSISFVDVVNTISCCRPEIDGSCKTLSLFSPSSYILLT